MIEESTLGPRGKCRPYNTVVRPAMVYWADIWAVKKAYDNQLRIAGMGMLRWMCWVTKLDRIKNERM